MSDVFRPFAAAILALAVLVASSEKGFAEPQFVDRALERGIDIKWSSFYPAGDLGAGLAMEDYDHDGDLDVFVATKRGAFLGVFRNDGATFTDISGSLALSLDYDIKQVLFADLDNDGWRELILSTWLPDETGNSFLGSRLHIYQGQSDGTFLPRNSAVIDSTMAGLATGVAAGDLDRDGDLDLYISVWKLGQADATSSNRMLRNDRDWNFSDQAAELGVDDQKKSYQVMLADLSGDDWLDIVVAEDKRGGATYYESNGDGTFTDRTDASGLDGYVFVGGIKADGMGLAVGDIDGDFDLDLYMTNIFDGNLLYRNNNDGTYTDVAVSSGTVSYRIGWGCNFFDCDNDQDQDLYVTNFGNNGAGNKTDRLYRNLSNGTFEDIAETAGITLSDDGFGMAAGDIDGNGAVDILLSQAGTPVRLLMNEGAIGNWLKIDLVGTDSNRDAVGAKVKIWAGETVQFFEQHAGESYLSYHSHAMDIGLASATVADSVSVWWPTGETEMWYDLAAGERHVLTESSSQITAPEMLASWVNSTLMVTWQVSDPLFWDSFELWREGSDEPEFVASQDAVPNQFSYSVNDHDATNSTSYSLRSARSGSGEIFTSNLDAPAEVPLSGLQLDSPRPNPFNPRVVLRYYVPNSETPELRIYDVKGREIARLAASGGGGWQSATWNGIDSSGRAMASGVYVFEIRTSAESRTTTMSLIR
ncbi:MAG: hypothetical protein ACI9JE_000718 [Candidatus Krumholzibacteriia bacterium]|jgi:hypothetical protein